jgi:FixJ family two-component response regulator
LVHGDVFYGTLSVYANRAAVFDDELRTVLEELGNTIGYAINAAQIRRAFLAESVVELELRIRETDDPLVKLARGAGCEIEFAGSLPEAEDEIHLFLTTRGVAPERILSLAEEFVAVESIQFLAQTGEECKFRVVTSGPTLPVVLSEHGAIPRRLSVTDEGAHVRVEVPTETDIRAFVSGLRRTYATVDLLARRQRDRPVDSGDDFESKIGETLTPRQLEVLRTAYLSGYFTSPRESTGEQIAANLDISQPTFSHHLRSAQRKLFSLLFDSGTATEAR